MKTYKPLMFLASAVMTLATATQNATLRKTQYRPCLPHEKVKIEEEIVVQPLNTDDFEGGCLELGYDCSAFDDDGTGNCCPGLECQYFRGDLMCLP